MNKNIVYRKRRKVMDQIKRESLTPAQQKRIQLLQEWILLLLS